MKTLSILAVSLGAIAAMACGSSIAQARPGQTHAASPSANVPQSEIQEGLQSLTATAVKDPGLTPVLFKPISTRALKVLRPFLKNSPSLITDKRLADAADLSAAPPRLFVAQLRDEGAGHDLLFVMYRPDSPACTPSAQRVRGKDGGDGCDIELIVDDGQISNWRTQKGIGSDPGALSLSTAGGPVFFLKASGSMSVLYCQAFHPTEAWQSPFTYSGPVKNPDGSYGGNSRLRNVNPNGPMRC